LGEEVLRIIRRYTHQLAERLGVIGLMNVQYAVLEGEAYVLEVNPRASRTVPFVSKATGIPWAKVGAWVMAGLSLKELGLGITEEPRSEGYAIKAPVFPFERFWVDPLLGPEMKSTGEVMGRGQTLGEAFAKTQMSLKSCPPRSGCVFISVNDPDKSKIPPIAHRLRKLGFQLMATQGTASVLRANGIPVEIVRKLREGHPNVIDLLKSGHTDLIINTPLGKSSYRDDTFIRLSAMRFRIPYVTTIEGAEVMLDAIEILRKGPLSVQALRVSQMPTPAKTE
jgi:carbamoyl-phosphate synthase large subunit